MKKIILTASIIMNMVLAGVVVSNSPTAKAEEKVTVEKTWYQEDGDMIIDLNDGSWICYNPEKEVYAFQPVNMGDWDYEFESADHLEKAVQTYMNIANGLGW